MVTDKANTLSRRGRFTTPSNTPICIHGRRLANVATDCIVWVDCLNLVCLRSPCHDPGTTVRTEARRLVSWCLAVGACRQVDPVWLAGEDRERGEVAVEGLGGGGVDVVAGEAVAGDLPGPQDFLSPPPGPAGVGGGEVEQFEGSGEAPDIRSSLPSPTTRSASMQRCPYLLPSRSTGPDSRKRQVKPKRSGGRPTRLHADPHQRIVGAGRSSRSR